MSSKENQETRNDLAMTYSAIGVAFILFLAPSTGEVQCGRTTVDTCDNGNDYVCMDGHGDCMWDESSAECILKNNVDPSIKGDPHIQT